MRTPLSRLSASARGRPDRDQERHRQGTHARRLRQGDPVAHIVAHTAANAGAHHNAYDGAHVWADFDDAGAVGAVNMAWLNIVGILILFFMGRPALRALKDYEAQRNAGVTEYTFDPKKLGIRNADFWEK